MPGEGKTRYATTKHSEKAKRSSKTPTASQTLDISPQCQVHVGSLSPAVSSASAISSNWKSLAKELGLDTSHRKRDKIQDRGKCGEGLKAGLKRRKWTRETHDSKRRKVTVATQDSDIERDTTLADGPLPHSRTNESLLITGSDTSARKCVSLDCEMVGTGSTGDFSMLARCSIVNHHGNVLYDSYVAPMDKITDYRTKYSGITPRLLRDAPDFKTVQKDVSELIKDRILVGHAVHHDLKVLLLSHPWRDIRDTSKFACFRQLSKGKTPSLKKLAEEVLGISIQQSRHDSIEDARVAMRLYQTHKKKWESMLKAKRRRKGKGQ